MIAMLKRSLPALGCSLLMLVGCGGRGADEPVKIGFVVKQAEEPWFLDEWKFARQAAAEQGFTLVEMAAEDGEKLTNALNTLGAQNAAGVILCVPDVKLGPAVTALARQNGLKLMTVDDQMVDGEGKPLADVPHMGISARDIGGQVGEAIAAEISARGWNAAEVGALRVSFDELPTARDRVEGAVAVLTQNNVPTENIFNAPMRRPNTEEAFNAANIVISGRPQFKQWVVFGPNDETVLGAVRALEGAGMGASAVIGVGIGGADSAISEFRKPEPTGFFSTVIISPRRHGYETALSMLNWIKTDQPPERLVLTTGVVATRDSYPAVRRELGLE